MQAINDFVALFKEATDITLSVVYDDGSLTFDKNSRYIVLGGANISDLAGISVNEDLKDDGFSIITKKQSIFINSKTTRGVMYGAYELLSILFDYERFTPDTYAISHGVDNLALPKLNVTDQPSFDIRLGGWGSVYNGSSYANAEKTKNSNLMRFEENRRDIWVDQVKIDGESVNIPWVHNASDLANFIVNKGDKSSVLNAAGDTVDLTDATSYATNKVGGVNYYGYKTGWFWIWEYSDEIQTEGDVFGATANTDSPVRKYTQLCYSGGSYAPNYSGVKHFTDEFEDVVLYVANRMIKVIDKDTSGNKYIQFSAEDNHRFCQCEACRSWYSYYSGGPCIDKKHDGIAGTMLRFVNALAKKIVQLRPDLSDYKIVTFIYSAYTNAPVKTVNGNYVAIDDAVICPENVAIYLAPNMDYTANISDTQNQTNVEMMKVLNGLDVICDEFGVWLYQMSMYDDYFLPANNYGAYANTYTVLNNMGAKWIFHQGAQINSPKNTAFEQLKLYLNSKLAWDCSLDEWELIDKFFNGYFGSAANKMRAFFDEVYALAKSNGGTTSLSASLFDKDTLNRWLSYCESALEDIEYLKTENAALYAQYEKNIKCEMMMPKYLLIRLYKTYNGEIVEDTASLGGADGAFTKECLSCGLEVGNGQANIKSVNLSFVG